MSAVRLIATDILQMYIFFNVSPNQLAGAPRNNIYQLRTLENALKPRKKLIKNNSLSYL